MLKTVEEYYQYEGKLIKVIDGDTCDMQLCLGMGIYIDARIRFKNVDAPEIFGVKKESEEYKQGKIALMEVLQWFFVRNDVYKVRIYGRGYYGRWIGEIFKPDNKKSLNRYLQERNYKSKYWSFYTQTPLNKKWRFTPLH